MEFQKFQITEDGRFFLDGFEVNNVKEFEIKSSAGKPAELILKVDVIIDQVGFGLKQL